MNPNRHPQGEVHDPGVVPAEDIATGAPDPSVLKQASEEASRGDDSLARALAADTERRRAQLADAPAQDADAQGECPGADAATGPSVRGR